MSRSLRHAPVPPSGGPARPLLPRRFATAGLGLALLVALLVVRTTVATPMRVSSASMAPTFSAGDVVLVTRQAPELSDLRRGDLVTFRSPEDGRPALKRVVGLPGERVVILDSRLYVDDRPVHEPYVDHALIDGYYSRTYRVPDDQVFLLGDNRGNSVDSRDYGSVSAESLLGRALFRVWPPVRKDGPAPSPPLP